MPLRYPILCSQCGRPALYKVAARWSDGLTEELKTYALVCDACLPDAFRESRLRQAACRLARGETLDPASIYRLTEGARDRDLVRVPELES